MNPGVPGRLLCRGPAIPTGATGQNLIPILHFHFHDTVQTYKVSPSPEALLPQYALQVRCAHVQGILLKPVLCPLWDTVSPRKSKAAHEVPGFSELWITPLHTHTHSILWEEMTSILGHVFYVYSAIPIVVLQVPGPGPAVHISGLPASALRLHPRPGPQATALLPQLHRDHAQRSRRREAGHPGVSASVPGPPLELYHHR